MSARGWAWLLGYSLGLGGPCSLALAGYRVGLPLLVVSSVALLWGLHRKGAAAPRR